MNKKEKFQDAINLNTKEKFYLSLKEAIETSPNPIWGAGMTIAAGLKAKEITAAEVEELKTALLANVNLKITKINTDFTTLLDGL